MNTSVLKSSDQLKWPETQHGILEILQRVEGRFVEYAGALSTAPRTYPLSTLLFYYASELIDFYQNQLKSQSDDEILAFLKTTSLQDLRKGRPVTEEMFQECLPDGATIEDEIRYLIRSFRDISDYSKKVDEVLKSSQ